MSTILSTETISRIEDILTSLDQLPMPAATNRRQKARLNVRMTIDATVLGSNNRLVHTVFTRNISTSGIGFVTRRTFKPKEFIVLPFKVHNLAPKLVLATITFCRYVKGGMYEVGAEFVESCDLSTEVKDNIPPHWIQMAAPKLSANLSN